MKRFMALGFLMVGPVYGADEVMKACTTLKAVSISAIENRNSGRNEADMRASIPALSEVDASTPPPVREFVTSMHEILDEIYAFSDLNPEVYSIYRMERCFRRMTDQTIPNNFGEVAPKLKACASQEEGKVECAMEAAGSDRNAQ